MSTTLTQRLTKEAAAIAAYESQVRAVGRGPSWLHLPVAERQAWRYRITETVDKEVA